ncbi:MAG: NADH-quinone oxidoreductase subunit M, partial [Bacteroidota bacterium]
MNLSLLILIPLLTAFALFLCKGLKQVRSVAFAGSAIQLLMAGILLCNYWNERVSGNSEQMLFQFRATWFAP